MIASEVAIPLIENNDASITLAVFQLNADGDRTGPYNFTGATDIEFILKDGVDSATAIATYKLSDNKVAYIGGAATGEISVQIAAADITTGHKRYRVDVIRTGGKRETVMAGPVPVRNL